MPIQFDDQSYEFEGLVEYLREKHPEISNPDAYAAELDMEQNGACQGKNYQLKMVVASKITPLTEYDGRQGHFISTFLINDDINFNGWMTTDDANRKREKDWIGKPGVRFWSKELNRWDHPEYDSEQEALDGQEDYRVATILKLIYHAITNTYEQISEIHDDQVWQDILDKKIQYVSPSAWPRKAVNGITNPLIVTDYGPLHYAFVDDPAFGFKIATVNGTCDGTTKQCLSELGPLVASVSMKIEKIILQTKPKISQIANPDKTETLTAKTENEIAMEKEITQLKAGIVELKEQIKAAKDDDEDEDKKNKKDSEKQTEDQISASIKNHPEFKQIAAANEKLLNIAKQSLIETMLKAAKASGLSEEEIKEQKDMMLKASVDELESMNKFVKPFAKHAEKFQVSASRQDDEFPDIAQLSGSTSDDDSEETDTDLLRKIGAIG